MVEGGDSRRKDAADVERAEAREKLHSTSPQQQSAERSDEDSPETWQRATIKLLIGYLSLHLLAIAFLTINAVLNPPQPDGFWGPVYKDVLQWDWQKAATWVVAPMSGVMSVASLWRADMAKERRWLIRISIAGIAFSALFYIVVIWMAGLMYLWSDNSYPTAERTQELSLLFAKRNCAVFAASLFGALGVKLPAWLGSR